MSISHPNLTCVTSRQQLAVQRTAIHGRSGLQNLDGCTRLKYVDVTGLKNLKGLIPNRLLRKPGLRLSLAGSGLEKEDLPHGNQDRYALSSADMLLFMTFLANPRSRPCSGTDKRRGDGGRLAGPGEGQFVRGTEAVQAHGSPQNGNHRGAKTRAVRRCLAKGKRVDRWGCAPVRHQSARHQAWSAPS